ncbi:hypothetical protein ACHAXT_007606 [Thalassiosira profunda]
MARRIVLLLAAPALAPPGALGFAPAHQSAVAPGSLASERRGAPSSPSPRLRCTSLCNSRDQAEQYLVESYPQFYYLLQQNPAALQRMHESTTGFAVFAPSDAAMEAIGAERWQLLEAACTGTDPGLQQFASRMASYHHLSAPTTQEILATYNVVNTQVGELPVEVGGDGTLYVNGVRIVQSYQFEDREVQNYQDAEGNHLGSEVAGGKRCIIHEVEGMLCPEELWEAMYAQYQSIGMEAM